MPSPFPGMNPYLEQTQVWHDFHERLVPLIAELLGPQILPRYIAKIVSQEKLADEQKAFAGLYYVNFSFVNVRAEANQGSTKLGEIPGRAFVHPLSINGDWANENGELIREIRDGRERPVTKP